MKLNLEKYRTDVKCFEEQLRAHKMLMRAPGYEQSFDYGKLFALRAQVTRLYCLRAESRGRLHPIQGGFRIQHVSWRKEPLVINMEGPNGASQSIYDLGREAMGSMLEQLSEEAQRQGIQTHGRRGLQRLIIDGETGWKQQYLAAAEAAA